MNVKANTASVSASSASSSGTLALEDRKGRCSWLLGRCNQLWPRVLENPEALIVLLLPTQDKIIPNGILGNKSAA
jgi:hypothetical protein